MLSSLLPAPSLVPSWEAKLFKLLAGSMWVEELCSGLRPIVPPKQGRRIWWLTSPLPATISSNPTKSCCPPTAQHRYGARASSQLSSAALCRGRVSSRTGTAPSPLRLGLRVKREQSSDADSAALRSCHFKISFTIEISWDSSHFPHARILLITAVFEHLRPAVSHENLRRFRMCNSGSCLVLGPTQTSNYQDSSKTLDTEVLLWTDLSSFTKKSLFTSFPQKSFSVHLST